MRVLVTGVAGFLGSWLAQSLIDSDCEVAGVDNLIGGYRDNVPDKCDFIVADVCNLEVMTEIASGCDVAYHCAALAYEGLSVFSPLAITDNIVCGSTSVMVAAIRNGLTRVVNCSSMARYGNNPTPYGEGLVPRPVEGTVMQHRGEDEKR